jgi:hypothetical protein
VNAISEFDNQSRKYDPYSNQHNLGWRDHSSLRYGQPSNQQHYQSFGHYKLAPPPNQASSSDMSLEEIMKSLASNTQMFQLETRASIQNLETQVSQLTSSLSKRETSKEKLSSQAKINLRENASAITLRSGAYYLTRFDNTREKQHGNIPNNLKGSN